MIAHNVTQGTPEWLALRLGIPTASNFDRIIQPSKLEYSKGARTYINELVAEHILGEPLDSGTSPWMERGTQLEVEARDWYAMDQDVDVETVGFCTTDDGRVGASPDGKVTTPDGLTGGLEIKCFGAAKHVGCLLGEDVTTPGQIQGGLWVTGWDFWDVVAYSPAFPPTVIRAWPDQTYQDAFTKAVARFLADLDHAKRHLTILGERGRREDTRNSLLAKLRASLQADQGDEAGEPLTLDEIEIVRDQLYLGIRAGAIDNEFADVLRVLIVEAKWARARERWSELQRRMSIREAS